MDAEKTADRRHKPGVESANTPGGGSIMSLARDVTTVGGGTLVSRLLGYARDSAIAALLGAGPLAEAFFAVFQVVNFFRRLLAEGALNSAFAPLWLGLRGGADGEANADRLTRRSLVTMFCLTGAVAMLTIVFAPNVVAVIAPGFDRGRATLAAIFLMLAAPYVVLAGMIAVLAAALNAERRVAAVTVSTIIFNLVMAIALIAVWPHGADFATGIRLTEAIVAAAAIQLLIVGIAWLKSGARFRRVGMAAPDRTRTMFARAWPGLIAAGIPQLKLIAGAAIASASPAAVSWLYYAYRLYELPLGVASIAIAAVIGPRIAASLGDEKDAAAVQSRAYEIGLGLALPAAAGFALLASPIAAGLFEHGAFGPHDTEAVAAALAAICAGLPGHILEKVLGAIAFARGDTRTPMLTALCGLAAAIGFGLLLFPRFGHVGVAAAIAISGWAGAGLLGAILYRRGWLRLDLQGRMRLPRIVLAAVAMAGIVLAAYLAMPPPVTFLWQIVQLAALVSLGIAAYMAALQLFGAVRVKDLLAAIKA
jgi:putative peptidoglycan lipid II flippase